MQNLTIKQIAEYCRDYIDLVSPSVMSRGGKRVRLPEDVFSAEPLLIKVPEFNYDDQAVIIPINLSTKLSDLSIESEDAENVTNQNTDRDLAIARELDDIYRKYETNNYTKQLSLQFGHISFGGVPNFDEENDELEESGYKKADGYLFSVPIILNYKDANGRRVYEIQVDDTLIKTNIGFVKNYMKIEYRDELYKFVALESNDENSSVPMNIGYVDELWSKIMTYLEFSEATDIIETPDMANVIIALEPKANYFLSQDLTGIIQAADDDTLGDTSLSVWIDKDEKYTNEAINDRGNQELFFPFAYDKYQLQVLSKINNKGLIVEGPPGTGKSQTISNILVHIAATGKKVLFVSQKDQAVRGVKDKLKTLDIPYLFGYMPDRSSRLHTDEDEKDSATYALRGISQTYLDSVLEKDPRNFLSNIALKVPSFNNTIDEARTYVQKHEEWSYLDIFDFGTNSTEITELWYLKICELRKDIETNKIKLSSRESKLSNIENHIEHEMQIQTSMKATNSKIYQGFKEKYDYQWLNNEQEYVRGIGYKELTCLTNEITAIFEASVVDRKINILSTKLNEFKLSKEIDRTLRQLPRELYETYKSIIFSEKTKTERRILLEEISMYFSTKAKCQDALDKSVEIHISLEKEQQLLLADVDSLETKLGELNNKLNSELLDDISMQRFERLFFEYNNDLFAKIHRRHELGDELKRQRCLNLNRVHEEIMNEKKEYNTQVRNYIRNRIAKSANEYRSQKKYRSALESIAWKLSKTKKAYKTFDRLKSDPFNFEAMSAVTPIWMMGLDDASRILPLQSNLFDYVIIDEASQCNISYTLPVMYRAKHAILFGDTLQMRDTTIAFKSNNQLMALARKHRIPEELQIKAEGDSVKSVMDIAKLNGFEISILKKHYRSPIELIGFSNENFYAPKNRKLEVVNDDILATEDGRVLKTHLVQQNPNAEISSKTNLTEAYYIKQLVEKIKSEEKTKGKSIAVLSFFNEQAELLKRVIPDGDVKISAIEGIQGDERDIVIYSLVITSPNDKRRYTALTGESGEIRKEINEGRVNVAFSRARLQVHVVTSLEPNLWPDGIWIKKYLEYIEKHGRVNRLSKSEQHFDSRFEEEVYNYLMKKLDINEFRVSTQVESCGFKIDQVITNIKTGKKLAIECDGPTHFEDGDGQVRVENDFERQFVLETAHWTFYRISYIDWQQKSESAQKELLNAIKDHFSSLNDFIKKNVNTLQSKEHKYEAISVEIPDSVITEQKDRVTNQSTNTIFNRCSDTKKTIVQDFKDKEITENEDESKIATQKSEAVVSNVQSQQTAIKKEIQFNHVGVVKLSSRRSIIVSRLEDGNYWFNEKVEGPNYKGITQKGFGLKPNDWNDFKTSLSDIANSLPTKEKRFRLNESTELVIYHPSDDTVEIRQYVTSEEFTGWSKKGIRVTNENAKKISEQL